MVVSRRNPPPRGLAQGQLVGIPQYDFYLLGSGVAFAECQMGKSEVVVHVKVLKVTVWRHLASIPLLSPPEIPTRPLRPPNTRPARQHLYFTGVARPAQKRFCLPGSFRITHVQ